MTPKLPPVGTLVRINLPGDSGYYVEARVRRHVSDRDFVANVLHVFAENIGVLTGGERTEIVGIDKMFSVMAIRTIDARNPAASHLIATESPKQEKQNE